MKMINKKSKDKKSGKMLVLIAVIAVLFSGLAIAPAMGVMPAHMKVVGENQGAIEGSCDMEGREGTIMVYGLDQEIYVPWDPQVGSPTGKRIHGPLTIIKDFDKSSPKLYQALCTGEQLSNVAIKFYRIDPTGMKEHYFTITLEDAIIVSMRPYFPIALLPESDPYGHMEDVSFTYKKIKWSWEPDGIESGDSWRVPT